jgi:hypothetical protein
MDTQIRDALEKAAKQDARSVGNLLEKIAAEWLREHGFLEPETSARRGKKDQR